MVSPGGLIDEDTSTVEPSLVDDDNTEEAGERAARSLLDWLNRYGGWIGALLVVGVFAGLLGIRIGEPNHPAADSVEVGFLQDMYYHHDQAVEMSLIMASDATDRIVRGEAQEIIVQQRFEQGAMAAWLGEWGYDLGELDRFAMAWMGMPTPVAKMEGVQSDEAMAELRRTTGTAKDILFLEMMIEHHRGGVHMAEYAAKRSDDPRVRAQAEVMARNQALEIPEMIGMMKRLERDG